MAVCGFSRIVPYAHRGTVVSWSESEVWPSRAYGTTTMMCILLRRNSESPLYGAMHAYVIDFYSLESFISTFYLSLNQQ
jgi:hypothetical protein